MAALPGLEKRCRGRHGNLEQAAAWKALTVSTQQRQKQLRERAACYSYVASSNAIETTVAEKG